MNLTKNVFKRIFFGSLLMTLLALSFSSCAKKSVDYVYEEKSFSSTGASANRLNLKSRAEPMMMNDAITSSEADTSFSVNKETQEERKLIRSGSISLEVQDLKAAEASIIAWCDNFKGYISYNQVQREDLHITAHIPSSSFDKAMEEAGQFGKLKDRQVSSEDVTESYYDLSGRLANKRILRDRLQNYLKTAKDMKDLLSIETELNGVLSEIDSMEGRLRRMSTQIDFSTVELWVSLPSGTNESGFVFPEVGDSFREFISNVVFYFAGFLFLIFYIVIYGVPAVLLAAGIYWVTFGKIGLVKKLFIAASSKRNKTLKGDKTDKTEK